MPEYTVIAACMVLAVLILEFAWLRTGILRTAQFWLAMLIVWGFQIPVDGWLTKAGDTIVLYDDAQNSGVRIGWNSPIEDFAFGFAMVTLTLLLWHRITRGSTVERQHTSA